MICATRIHNNESLTPYAPYDGTSVIEERSNSSLLAHYRYAGKLLALSTPQGNQYYHLDALGSTTELTDDQGDIKASYHLDPWGSIEEITGDSINRRIFTGKETDQNTGLINIGVRYYDPETARFITQDSYLGKQDEPPSLHRYLYAYSNPTVYVDLEGYASIKANLNGMATLAANLFGDLILRNNESVPRLVNGKLISERKSYEVNFEGADPRKWIKTRTAEYDALAAYNKQLSDRGAIAKGALDYHTLGLSGMVTGNFDAVKGVGRSLSSLKRSFDSSLSEAEQNTASFEAGHEFLSSAVVLGTIYRAKPSVVRTVESKAGAAQAAVIEMESVGGSWVKKNSGRIFTKETFGAPSGKTYNFYGQKIDLDLEFRTPQGRTTTNRKWMEKGNNPYVLSENGVPVPTNQHHSQQRSSGPIFEIKTTTHKNSVNQKALHPYDQDGLGKNTYDPVDHTIWNKDRQYINKERLKRLESYE